MCLLWRYERRREDVAHCTTSMLRLQRICPLRWVEDKRGNVKEGCNWLLNCRKVTLSPSLSESMRSGCLDGRRMEHKVNSRLPLSNIYSLWGCLFCMTSHINNHTIVLSLYLFIYTLSRYLSSNLYQSPVISMRAEALSQWRLRLDEALLIVWNLYFCK